MAYRSPGGAYSRRNTIRREINNSSVQAQDTIKTETPPEPLKEEKKPEPVKRREVQKNPLSAIFGSGKPDNDKIIIIALIVILAREGADIKLLLALGYILM